MGNLVEAAQLAAPTPYAEVGETSEVAEVAEVAEASGGWYDPAMYGPPAGEWMDPQDVARDQLTRLEGMTDEGKQDALKELPPEDVERLMTELPAAERVRLVELARHSDDPHRKLDLFLAGQRARVEQDANAELDDQMDPELATQMEERRERIAASTRAELEQEEARLRERGEQLTEADVAAMIARKTKEHDLEMGYNLNLTATGEMRRQTMLEDIVDEPPSALDGKRVEWTEAELDVLDRALKQAPAGVARNNPNLEVIERHEKLGTANADHTHTLKRIRLFDRAISNGPPGYVIDPRGIPADDEKREPNIDPSVKAEGGANTTFMEWVVLHELGHNNHDFASSDAFEDYKKALMIRSLDDVEVEVELGEEKGDELASAPTGTRVQAHGFTYLKQQDGSVKKFPSDVFDEPDADPQIKEWWAQHHNQAILAPESTAVEYLDAPEERVEKAGKSLEAAGNNRAALVAAGADTTEIDRRIAELEEEQRRARVARGVWANSYEVMRGAFHADDAEKAAVSRLAEDGYDTAEFEKQAARLSTPEQIARLEEELRKKKRP